MISPPAVLPTDPLAIAVRAYVPAGNPQALKKANWARRAAGPSEYALVFDTETITDAAQQLRLGSYQLRKDAAIEEAGLFYDPDSLTEPELQTLRDFAARHGLRVLTVSEFIEAIFYGIAYELGATIVGFNLPWDLSRLAVDHASARGKTMHGGFSLQLSDNPKWPRVQVKHLSQRAALIRFAAQRGQRTPRGQRKRGLRVPARRGFFVDLRSVAAALLSRPFSLGRLAEFLGVPNRKLDTEEHGALLTKAYLDYAVRDAETTWECFLALRERYRRHGLGKTPIHRVLSEASLGKAYLREMGIKPWREVQPDASPSLVGTIMSTYFGGRSEVHLRRVICQVAYCDFLSMYPTVCTLMGLWQFVVAHGMTSQDATEEVRNLLRRLALDDLRCRDTWRLLPVLVQVEPNADLFPIRAKYGGDRHYTIGLNHLTSRTPLWVTLADCLASMLLTGRAPKVLQALRFVPNSVQSDLQPIAIAGNPAYRVDPAHNDFYRRLVDLRSTVKARMREADGAERHQRDAEQLALKILANATSYGIFVELNVEELAKPKPATCFGYDGESFPVEITQSEDPGRCFHPLLATLITGAARLMLAIAEHLVLNCGLDWAFCDTDSIAVAKPAEMADAEFFARVEEIREWFAPLNPYASGGSILKMEDANFAIGRNSVRAPLYCFAISAKRYVLFNLDDEGRPILRKASAHGLGHLLPPYAEKDAPLSIPAPVVRLSELGVECWQHDVWYRIVSAALAGSPDQVQLADLPEFDKPAVSRYAATTPTLLRWFKSYNRGKPYREQIRPFGFLLAFQATRLADLPASSPAESSANEERQVKRALLSVPRAVAPFDREPTRAATHCFDRETGEAVSPRRLKSYRQALLRYHLHPEAKFLGGDYTARGPTRRRHIEATAIHLIGKEAHRWEEQFHLGADPEAQNEYGLAPHDRERILAAIREAAKTRGGKQALALKARISRQHLAMILSGKANPGPAALLKLSKAAILLSAERRRQDAAQESTLTALRNQSRNLGLRPLATRIGITPAYLGRILARSRKPSPTTLAKLRQAVAEFGSSTVAATPDQPLDPPPLSD